jgi:hypothetical protein
MCLNFIGVDDRGVENEASPNLLVSLKTKVELLSVGCDCHELFRKSQRNYELPCWDRYNLESSGRLSSMLYFLSRFTQNELYSVTPAVGYTTWCKLKCMLTQLQ